MKLAEALIQRADMQKKLAALEDRMNKNARVQEGDEPAEDVNALMKQYEAMMRDLEKLIVRINKTNSVAGNSAGTIAAAIARRDCLKSKIRVYKTLYDQCTVSADRYSNSEIRFVRCVDAKKLQSKIDSLSKEYRELDTCIQAQNWNTDLLD